MNDTTSNNPWSVKVVFTIIAIIGLISGCASSDNANQCGTVSAYLKPDTGQYLYRTIVTHLDGVPVISRPNYVLPVGEHQFTVVELINSPELKVSLSARGTKILTINVEADQRYHIGAQMFTDKIYVGRNSDFWAPVVFQQESHQCEIDPLP
ncbi:hypothetical protein [Shewanella subflava]|uniref:DUF2846 domain-containing protein n=1 Tax=Shewanella subflava TaxID=2986476 RepID=A0ABT3I9A2_9GAMM|nr:hypothetical protein [Shewanella subflava]MCW3172641.1 hypothetical protein [Shewanella subflava]